MLSYIISMLYYLIPAAALLFFCISLARYYGAIRKNRRAPGSFSDEQIKVRKILFLISSVIAGTLLAVMLALIGLLMVAVAFM